MSTSARARARVAHSWPSTRGVRTPRDEWIGRAGWVHLHTEYPRETHARTSRGTRTSPPHMELLCHRHQPTTNKQEEITPRRPIDRSTKRSSPHSHQPVNSQGGRPARIRILFLRRQKGEEKKQRRARPRRGFPSCRRPQPRPSAPARFLRGQTDRQTRACCGAARARQSSERKRQQQTLALRPPPSRPLPAPADGARRARHLNGRAPREPGRRLRSPTTPPTVRPADQPTDQPHRSSVLHPTPTQQRRRARLEMGMPRPTPEWMDRSNDGEGGPRPATAWPWLAVVWARASCARAARRAHAATGAVPQCGAFPASLAARWVCRGF